MSAAPRSIARASWPAGQLAALLWLTSCGDGYPALSVLGPERQEFRAVLTGAAERPDPVSTGASGDSFITVLDQDRIRIEILVSAIDSVTQAHLHAGTAGEVGPFLTVLYGPVAGTAAPTRLDGVLRLVELTRSGAVFTPPFTFDSLRTRIAAGTAYLDVHTRTHPEGESRGQIGPR